MLAVVFLTEAATAQFLEPLPKSSTAPFGTESEFIEVSILKDIALMLVHGKTGKWN